MSRETCLPGTKWDKLLVTCVASPLPLEETRPLPQPRPTTVSPPVVRWVKEASATPAEPALSPAVWVSVVVVVNGSILALCLWFILYRLRTTNTHSTGDPEAELQVPAKTHLSMEAHTHHAPGVVIQSWGGGPSSSPQMNGGGTHTAYSQEGGLPSCRGPPGWGDGLEEVGLEGGLVMCRAMREHGIPLPATELGDAALVTTKTAVL